MRADENRSAHRCRQARGPAAPGEGRPAASSSRTNPVMPSSTISGTDPHGVATTGVPQASASIITIPNGSGHAIGLSRQVAPASSSQLVLAADLADVLDVATEQRLDLVVEVGALGRLAHLGGDPQRHPGGAGDPGGRVHALVRAHPPEEQRRSRRHPCPIGNASTSTPWWITAATGMSPADAAWWSRDGDDRHRAGDAPGRSRRARRRTARGSSSPPAGRSARRRPGRRACGRAPRRPPDEAS